MQKLWNLLLCGPAIPGHGACPAVWVIHPVALRWRNRFGFSQQISIAIASWEGVGFCVHLSLLPFNFVPVGEEKHPSRGLGANSANYQGSITHAECSLVTCWLGIRKSSSHETGLQHQPLSL